MFNLLPDIEKKKILQEYSLRRFVVMFLFLFVSGIIALIAFFPSQLLTVLKVSEVEGEIKNVQKSTVFAESVKLNSTFSDINLKLSALNAANSSTSVRDVLQRVLDKKTAAIRIKGFTFKYSLDKSPDTLAVSGTANDRESLSQFVNELEKDTYFSKVNLPVSSLTKNINPDFTIQIEGNF